MICLRDSIPKELQGKLVIKVVKSETKSLVEEAEELAALNPQYGEPWIIFDRDQVKDFDEIIRQAKAKGIKVGWTNLCIEAWFSTYFGSMLTYQDSVSCCSGFRSVFKKKTGYKYSKSDSGIYSKLIEFGDETEAIKIAQRKLEEHRADCKREPSEMCPCTTVHLLVDEIKSKIIKN